MQLMSQEGCPECSPDIAFVDVNHCFLKTLLVRKTLTKQLYVSGSFRLLILDNLSNFPYVPLDRFLSTSLCLFY